MAEIAAFATIASTAMAAFQSVSNGNTQKAMLDAEATQQRTQAGQERAAAQYQEEVQRRKTKQVIGQYNAQMGATGSYDPTYAVAGDIAEKGNQDERWIETTGEQRARNYENSASIKTAAGSAAQTGGYLGAIGATLKGMSGFAKQLPKGSFGADADSGSFYSTPGGRAGAIG